MRRKLHEFSDSESLRMELSSGLCKTMILTRMANRLSVDEMTDAMIISTIVMGSGLKTTEKDGKEMAPKVHREPTQEDAAAVFEISLDLLVRAKKLLNPLFEEYHKFSYEQITGEKYGR